MSEVAISIRCVSRSRRRNVSSKLFSLTWSIPGVGRVRVGNGGKPDALHADQVWAPMRPSTDTNLHWKWEDILDGTAEQFAVRRADDPKTTIGLWAAKGTITLPADGALYRLDYAEIDPTLRGGTLGAFVLAMAAERARETQCRGLAIPSLPETCKIYERLGAIPGVAGWNVSPPIAPYRMINGPFRRLLDLANEYEKET